MGHCGISAMSTTKPINPDRVTGSGRVELPAYLSNGVVGLRVRSNPLLAGMALVAGFSGLHPEKKIEAAAVAPYPIAGDIAINGVWMSDVPECCRAVDQAYDFSSGELTTRLKFAVDGTAADLEVLTFCCRHQPTLVAQELRITVDEACDLKLRTLVDARNIAGRLITRTFSPPGENGHPFDGSLEWQSAGNFGHCGVAHVTELIGDDSDPSRESNERIGLTVEYKLHARKGKTYRLRQIASLVPSVLHGQSNRQAERLVALGKHYGFEKLRAANRAEWDELWKGRIILHGAGRRWQALADAAFFYLNSSVHVGSTASTSIFGLATWHDYHYYYGHVMWDIETFCVPPLIFLQPEAAETLLEYRLRMAGAARSNAQCFGRAGIQYPWESAPSTGHEATPSPGTPSWHEDHATLDVALALLQFAHATGDQTYLADKAWPVLYGVARWIESRTHRTRTGYEFRRSMGIAERKQETDNDAYTLMAARKVLQNVLVVADRLGRKPPPAWRDIAARLMIPIRDGIVIPHDDYRRNEEKGATPAPLMGAFPLGTDISEAFANETFDFYLDRADEYVGSPMLSSLYGVWAAWRGKPALALRLLHEGYAQFVTGRFSQTLEYRRDKFPEQPMAGPFFANLGGFLMALLQGFPGMCVGPSAPSTWPQRKVVLPQGWKAIEVQRFWAHGKPHRLLAQNGAKRAIIEPV